MSVAVAARAGAGNTVRWVLSACLWAAAPGLAWPQAAPPATATLELGREVFLRKAVPACAVCHTLEAAAASGAVGPVLDELRPDAQRVAKAVRNGLGAMPPFQGVLSDAEIEAVAAYVAVSTGATR